MKQEIIEQMRAELYDNNWCVKDFEKFDLPSIQNDNHQFFWQVFDGGTYIYHIDCKTIMKYVNDEAGRFLLYDDMYSSVGLINWCAGKSEKLFYYDGVKLNRVERDEMKAIYKALYEEFIQSVIDSHTDEYNASKKPLEVRFASKETEERFQASCEFAETFIGNGLKECVEKLSWYRRIALNQYIMIYTDFEEHSFSWTEFVNDEPKMNGGIIYHGNNHWSIHT